MSGPIPTNTLDDVFRAVEAADIHLWISEQRQEDLTLDFKLAPRALEDSDERRALAKAISGFSNSAGGLIVWGVDARSDPVTKVDAASQAKPLAEPERMLSNLQRHSGTAVVPTASQVVHRLVASKEFALTLVPESDNPPHMAKFGHDQYFKRSGDSFYRMEHFDLEDMFGRRQRSRLVLRLRSQGNAIVLSLYNDGRRTAKAPYLALRIRSPFENSEYGVDGNGTFGLHILNRNRHQPSFGGNTTIVIHPGQTVDITRIKVGDLFDPKAEAPVGGHTFEYDIASEDEPLRTGVERLPW